jgi:hypothetical protein
MNRRDVCTRWEPDLERLLRAAFAVVLRQALANFIRFYAYDGIGWRFVIQGSAENGHADGSLLELEPTPIQSLFHNEGKEFRAAFAGSKVWTGEHTVQVFADHRDRRSRGGIRFSIPFFHTSVAVPLEVYTLTYNGS